MNRAERKRLEEAGWQVGSTADFLGLTPQESAYIELRIRLADALKERRQAARLSQKTFAMTMKSSQSRIAKAEAHDPTVSLDLLIRSLIALGVSLRGLARILDVEETTVDVKTGATSHRSKRKETKPSGRVHKRSSVKAANYSRTLTS
jgi:transcriptional regulator with XRE-family HTH domain